MKQFHHSNMMSYIFLGSWMHPNVYIPSPVSVFIAYKYSFCSGQLGELNPAAP